MRYVLVLLAVCFATPVSATVLISEIAWMGSTENTAHEWIELHNTSQNTITINQWKIEAQDGTPTLTLQGEMSAGAYLLIKRSVQTLPDHEGYIPPSFGALGNTGEMLFLKNASGEIIDTVEGIPWPAGDNTTKETMQRNGNQWVTAPATPGGPTVITSSSSPPAITTTPTGTAAPIPPQRVVAPTIRIVGAREATIFTPYQFHVVVTGASGEETIVHGVELYLGDGTQRTSISTQTQEHVYEFPGTYVLSARYQLWGRDPLIARHILTVREPRLSYTVRTENREAFIIKNESPHELSLHRFSLHNEHRFYTFPFGATVLPNGEMIIANSVLRFDLHQPVTLVYPNGEVYSFVTQADTSPVENVPSTEQTISLPTPVVSQRIVREVLPREEVLEAAPLITQDSSIETPPVEEKKQTIPPFVFLIIGGVLVFSLFQRLLDQPASSDEEA